MKKTKEKKGITLIALVITIIVLLILAGVVLSLALNQEGVISKSKMAANVHRNAESVQNKQMDSTANLIDQFQPGSTGPETGGELPEITPTTVAGTKVKKPSNYPESIDAIADGEGNIIPIPTDRVYVTGTKNTGVVIKDNIEGKENEWVWVPCTIDGNNGTIKYDRYPFHDATKNETTGVITQNGYTYGETMPEEERESVTKYGGYYIARYELGKDTSGNPVIMPNVTVYTGISRDYAQELAITFYDSSSPVTTRLCSSYAWDTALTFIEKNNSDWASNSVGGIYGQEEIQKTGLSTPKNGIYDMGGNVWEYISENCTNDTDDFTYGMRGGMYSNSASSAPAGTRSHNWSGESSASSLVGIRFAIFLKS